jgi:hypothetical protein
MNPPDQPCQATPAGDLRQQILDSRVPKNEREWWASREIEKLERELTETERLRFGADADRRQLRCDLSDAKAEASHYMAVAQKATDELIFFRADSLKAHQMTCAAGLERDSLRAEVERLTTKIGNQADRIRYLEGATNHATGTPLSQAIARAEKAEAELAEAKVERETIAQSSLRSLEAYIDKLKQFAERAEKAEADNAKWQKLLLMSRDDREIDLISEVEEQARLLGMSGEREADILGKLGRLESELAAIKHGHGELGKYEQLRLKNAELQGDKARLDWLAVSDTWFDYPATESFNPETFRDAIDAAMKGTP